MILYENTKAGFLKDVSDKSIAAKLENAYRDCLGGKPEESEVRSWENSPEAMGKVLQDEDIPDDCGIALEYCILPTSRRIDLVISGYDENNKMNVIIVELKQWGKLEAVPGSDSVVCTKLGGTNKDVVHPSYQAWSYGEVLYDYNQYMQEEDIRFSPCVYMHNYSRNTNDPLDNEQYDSYLSAAPVYTKGMENELQRFIKERIVKGDGAAVITDINKSKINPSKRLQDVVGNILNGIPAFILLDEEQVDYQKILKIAQDAKNEQKKQVVIVKGGPGTGKSAIAINLLAELTKEGQTAQYTSKNNAPRSVFKKKIEKNSPEGKTRGIAELFQSPDVYAKDESNSIDTVLVDEAHRLVWNVQKDQGEKPTFKNPIQEIIRVARCSVFFIDEDQRVSMSDMGSVEEIRKCASREGIEVTEMELKSQLRCSGGEGYLIWLNNVLGNKGSSGVNLQNVNFDFQIFDTPGELHEKIVEKNSTCENKARTVAGYCWDWKEGHEKDPEVKDIEIKDDDGTFEMSWNLRYDDSEDPYAVNEGSIDQIGCVHTVQGLEFDYIGVIIGDDLRYENGEIITDYKKRASTDFSLNESRVEQKKEDSIKKGKDPKEVEQLADAIIRNTYRVLMTRGMKGCYVYCTDQDLADYLRSQINTDDES